MSTRQSRSISLYILRQCWPLHAGTIAHAICHGFGSIQKILHHKGAESEKWLILFTIKVINAITSLLYLLRLKYAWIPLVAAVTLNEWFELVPSRTWIKKHSSLNQVTPTQFSTLHFAVHSNVSRAELEKSILIFSDNGNSSDQDIVNGGTGSPSNLPGQPRFDKWQNNETLCTHCTFVFNCNGLNFLDMFSILFCHNVWTKFNQGPN